MNVAMVDFPVPGVPVMITTFFFMAYPKPVIFIRVWVDMSVMTVHKVSIIGCGAFGYALTLLIAKTHADMEVYVFDTFKEYIVGLQDNRKHPFFYTDIAIPENVTPTLEAHACLADADLVILAVPAQYMRGAVSSIKTKDRKSTR